MEQYILFNEIDTLANLDGVNETVMFPAADRIAVYKALVQLLNTRTKAGYTVGANVLTGTFPYKCTAVAVTLS